MSAGMLTAEELAHATTLRRQFHTIPELAFEEFKTAELIRSELRRLNIEYHPGPPSAPTATIALLGDRTKPCVALRSDIDALPITEATGHPYASTHQGRMHACGHDGHMANLLTTALALKRQIANLPVCVKLIFQPAEEAGGGANHLVKAGVLDATPEYGPKVEEIFGLHGWPEMPAGTIATRPGPLMASTDALNVTVRGRGCHGAFPHLGVDPILAAAETIVSLQALVSREINPTDSAVVTVGKFHAGTATNVIPDTARFEATVRTLTPETRTRVKAALIRRCKGIAEAHGCHAEIEYFEGYPATLNNPALAERVADVARKVLGPARYFPAAAPVMGGEDFAYYLQKVPGAFFYLGVRPPDLDKYPPLHNDCYDFTDTAIEAGVALFVGLVQDFAARRSR